MIYQDIKLKFLGITSITSVSIALLLATLCVMTTIMNRRMEPLEFLPMATYAWFLVVSLVLAPISILISSFSVRNQVYQWVHRSAFTLGMMTLVVYLLFFLSPLLMIW